MTIMSMIRDPFSFQMNDLASAWANSDEQTKNPANTKPYYNDRAIKFKRLDDLDTSIKQYGFLILYLNDVAKTGAKPGNIYLSENNDFNGENIIFVYYEGALMCGSRGCMLEAYRKRDGQHLKIDSTIITHLPIYKHACQDEIYLTLDTMKSEPEKMFSIWRYHDYKFQYLKQTNNFAEICTLKE